MVCSVMLIILKKAKYDVSQLLMLFIYAIPIFGFSLFVITSKFNLDPNAEGYVAHQVFLIIATLLLPFLGYQCRDIKGFNLKKILLVIYKLLAFWMAINFIITLFQFGPFYTFIYETKYFYEYGHLTRLPIGQMAYMFFGVKVERVSIQVFVLFAGILSSSILGLFYVSYKEDKRSFLTYLICGTIGILCLLLTLNEKSVLSYLLLIIAFTLVLLFSKGIIKYNKVTKIVIYSLCGVLGILFILFILNASGVRPINDLIESVWLSHKIFNANDFSAACNRIIYAALTNKYFSGFTGYLIGQDSLTLSGSWLFDMLLIAQLLGLVCFITFVVLMFVRYVQYYKTSEDDKTSKIMLLVFILSIFLITLVGYNSMPSSVNEKYFPIFFTSPFLILLIIFGYIGKKEEVKNE